MPLMSAWSLIAVQSPDINMASGGNAGHAHQHDPWWQHSLMDNNKVSDYSIDYRLCMVLGHQQRYPLQ